MTDTENASFHQGNRRIARNTMLLYARMLVVMLVSLYSSRLLLKNLGVEDFGVYGLVGAIVTMFASLRSMFTVATQRYLNIEIGAGDKDELCKVFNTSLRINAIVAAIFVLLVEIGGIWLIQNKLNIADGRITAALWVFQFSVAAALLAILGIPYDSDIIAREHMGVYAAVSMFDVLAQLAIIACLPVIGGDKLIVYGFLVLSVKIINLIFIVIYCRKHFFESKFRPFSTGEIRGKFKEMFAFSGWAFFGNIIFALVNEGVNILLNIFGGVVANAARTIAYQVRGAFNSMVSNVYVAVKPQAIQAYASQNNERFYQLMFTGTKIVGYMYILIAVTLFFCLDDVLAFWLGSVPEYTTSFIRAILFYMFVRVLHESVGSFFVTIGRLKEYQIAEFLTLGSALPLSYIGLKFCGMPLYGVFLVMSVSEILNLTVMLFLAVRIGNFAVRRFSTTVLLPYVGMAALCFACAAVIAHLFSKFPWGSTLDASMRTIAIFAIQMVLISLLGLGHKEKTYLYNMVKSVLK